MRIALMTNNYKPFIGGVPISIERLKNGLTELGHEVTVFAPDYHGNRASNCMNPKTVQDETECYVVRYRTLASNFCGGIVLPNPYDRHIEEEFQKGDFDIIHVHHPIMIGSTALYLSRKYHVPIVFTYHTQYEKYITHYCKTSLLERPATIWIRRFLRSCDHLIAPTESIREYLIRYHKIAENQISVLPTGLENAQFQTSPGEVYKLRKRLRADHCPLFLTVCRMAKEKNVLFLIHSLAALKEQTHLPFRAVFVGDGPQAEYYRRVAAGKGLSDRIVFTGIMKNEEVKFYYAAADLFLFASKTETQGIVILEAFAGGTPVLAVDADGVRDLVVDGFNGWLTREREEEFTARLISYMEEWRDSKKGGNPWKDNALSTAREYREEAVARKAAAVYNSVIKESVLKNEGNYGKSISYFNC